jgi:hypothetical protein
MTILPQLEKDLYEAARQRLPVVDDPGSEAGHQDDTRALPAARWPRFRAGLGATAARLPLVASIAFALVIAAVALIALRHRHASAGAGRNGLIALIAPGRGGLTPNNSGVKPQAELVNPDGSGVRYAYTHACSSAVSQGDCTVVSLAWSADGTQLAYLAGVERPVLGNQYTLYLGGADGHVRRLTACGSCGDLSWSPDGSQIAVTRYTGTSREGTLNIWVINTKTGAMHPITCHALECAGAGELQWSPDGREILFVRGANRSRWSLDTIHPDGSHLTTITTMQEPVGAGTRRSPFEVDQNPRWSPDGRVIAFNHDHGIYTVNADGTGLKRIVPLGGNPAWSPDGTRLAYSTLKLVSGGALLGLGTINANGSGNRVLYERPWARYRRWIDNWGVQSWSRDGRQIAFAAVVRPSVRATWVINADGTGLRRIGPNTSELAWQPAP